MAQKMDAEVGVIGSVSDRYGWFFKIMELKTILSLINAAFFTNFAILLSCTRGNLGGTF